MRFKSVVKKEALESGSTRRKIIGKIKDKSIGVVVQ